VPRRLILLFAIVAPFATIALWQTSIVLAVGILFASHMLVLIPTLAANLGWLGPVASRFRTDGREVWLTIDDGPDPDDTLDILEILAAKDARATFFVKGELVERHPELVREIAARGHSIANHSHTHPSGSFWRLGPGAIEREIDGANTAIEKAAGKTPALFRAPVGMKNPFVHPILAARGMALVGWTARGWDTVSPPEVAAERIVRRAAPGAILLLHQGPGAAAGASPVECLGMVVDRLAAEGWTFTVPSRDALVF